jgi:hypothetical protein
MLGIPAVMTHSLQVAMFRTEGRNEANGRMTATRSPYSRYYSLAVPLSVYHPHKCRFGSQSVLANTFGNSSTSSNVSALQKFESSTILHLLGGITTVVDMKGNGDDSYGS